MRRRALVLLPLVFAWLTGVAAQEPPAADPFAAFRPWIDITAGERARADRGETVVRVLPSRGKEVAVLALASVRVSPEVFVARFQDIEALRTSSYSPATRRFSSPPGLADLARMSLPAEDLAAIRRCRPGACDVKLSVAEIARVRAIADTAPPGDDEALQREFREVVLERVTRYLAEGLVGLAPYADKPEQVRTADALGRLVERSPYLPARAPGLAAFLLDFPRAPVDERDSFVYWAEERFNGRPVLSATHVNIIRNDPASGLPLVMVAGKQLFATHYNNASLGLTCLVGSRPQYLLYVNRTEVDLLGGFFGAFKRAMLEGRVKREAGAVVAGLRARIETGAKEVGP